MKFKHLVKLSILTLLLLSIAAPVLAKSHYSYEHAEELKPLINWRDYGNDAFFEAIDQNKPVFLLLTAPSWCYWCQVYESEEYLFHPDIIKELNEKFIPVYVDADQRQDLTRQYLEGGWPSTTVLAPNKDRLYGYSGVRPVANMLANLRQATDFVKTSGFSNSQNFSYIKTSAVIPSTQQLGQFIQGFNNIILQAFDPINGGFGTGQKFPQGRTLDYALDLYERSNNQQWLNIVETTLENQFTLLDELENNYNLFDPIEGGFHRYGTRPDWTPPHYEKMLYDNAKLVQAYAHLRKIRPQNKLAQEVVTKTLAFIEKNWWDATNGGFYGNSDVHGEDEYYGKNPRPADKPRVEQTKYSDWNTDAIIAYISLWQDTNDSQFKVMAEKTLDFFAQEMVTDFGAYHYFRPDGQKGIRGNLLDNANLLVAFVEGYDAFGNDTYLATAKTIADYSLDQLYDWHGGGFFERNSPDIDQYAGDHILLEKPTPENGIISYALLKLYTQTNNPLYLNAGIKTLGNMLFNSPTLDRGFYYLKSAELILDENLLADFAKLDNNLKNLEKEKQKNFWVNDLIIKPQAAGTKFIPTNEGLENLESPLIILLLIALVAGFLSFASPCTLPILPAFLAYTLTATKKGVKGMTAAFFLGLILVFTLLGMSATVVGGFLRSNLTLFSQIAGIAIIIFGIMAILGKGFVGIKIKKRQPTTYLGSFFFGSAMGISWTPCIGPILVSILLLASTTDTVVTGGLLLLVYGLGLAVPLIILSTFIGRVNKNNIIWRLIEGRELTLKIGQKKLHLHTSALISGLLFIILGYLIFSGTLFTFNQYITTTPLQIWIFGLEDFLLNLLK